MGEKVLESLTSDDFKVRSCGLINFNKDYMHEKSKEYLKSIQLDLNHKTQKINDEIVNTSNLIYCLDEKIFNEVKSLFPQSVGKLFLLGGSQNIIDPINLIEEDYENVMQSIYQSCEIIAKNLNAM